MTDISKQRDKLRKFSNFKISQGYGAVRIYDEDQTDIAMIYKDGTVVVDDARVPKPNRSKLHEVIEGIKGKL